MTMAILEELKPCKDGMKFVNDCGGDFRKVWDTCERGDWLIWGLRRSGNLDKPTAVRLAIACARHVLDIYEKKRPGDNWARVAIESAEAWLKNPTEENRQKCRQVDAAAYADASAYAAYAAAYAAASASAYAAYAAAYAAASATDATATDAYATYAIAKKTEQKWQANKIRELVAYPFAC